MSATKLSLAILQKISDFLADLPEEDLVDIADGRALLTYIPAGAIEPRRPSGKPPKASATAEPPRVDPGEAERALLAMMSRQEGEAYLNNQKKFRVKPELVELARHLDLGSVGGLSKGELIGRIIQQTIGSRVNSAAIRPL